MRPAHPELVEHINDPSGMQDFLHTDRGLIRTQLRLRMAPSVRDIEAALAATFLAFDTLSFVDAFERGER